MDKVSHVHHLAFQPGQRQLVSSPLTYGSPLRRDIMWIIEPRDTTLLGKLVLSFAMVEPHPDVSLQSHLGFSLPCFSLSFSAFTALVHR